MATTQANQAIYDRLNGMQQFHPGNVTLLTDWSIEPGDVIQVQSGTDANGDAVFSPMPVYQLDMTWRGAVTAEVQATGNEKRPPLSALRRQNYSYGHGISQAQKTANEAVNEVVYISDFTKTDRGIGMLAQAIGVKIDEDTGLPAKDEHGEYIFDGVNGATLTGTLSVQAGSVIAEVQQARGNSQTLGSALSLKADTATLISAINSASGTIASGKVQVQPGNVLIEAINGADGTVTINAGKINLQGYVTATELAAGTISAISVGSGTLTTGTLNAANSVSIPNGTIDAGFIFCPDIVTTEGGEAYLHGTAVIDTQIIPDGSNGYKLQKKMYGSTSWTDAGSFSRAASIQTVSGSWSGSTYTVAADASGTALPKSVTIDAILAGGGTADFSAQIRDTSSGQSPTIIDSNAAHGYLAKSGNSVIVYTSRSGSTYSGPVASLSFQPEITAAVNTALGNVTVSGTWSGGKITIANSANSNTIVDYLRAGTATWNGTTVTVPVQHSTTPDTTSSFADTGQSVSVNVSGKLYNPGTITPTSSAQTISVPSGYIGFAGPLSIAAASGSGGYGTFLGFTDEPVVSGEYIVYSGGTINSSKTIYAVIENSYGTPITGPSITVSPPAGSVIQPKSSTITADGTYYATSDGVDGWSSVTVSVGGTSYSSSAKLKMYDLSGYNMATGDNRVYVKTPTGSYNPVGSNYTRIYVLSSGDRIPDNTTVHW